MCHRRDSSFSIDNAPASGASIVPFSKCVARRTIVSSFLLARISLMVAIGIAVTAHVARAQPAERPNVLIILVDDLGYGDLSSFNPNSKIETPHLDRLAQAGLRFTDAHAPGPLCHLSRYGLLTGRYPFREKVGQWNRRPIVGEHQVTIASLLKTNGYATHMVGKWHLGFDERGYDQPMHGGPVDCGFDSFFGIRASTDIPPYFYIRDRLAVAPPVNDIEANATEGWSPIQGAFWRQGKIAADMSLDEVLPRFTEESVELILAKQKSTKPFFLYLALPAPHTPWLPAANFTGTSDAGLYGDFVSMVDDCIGQVISALERTEALDNTLILFTSDNGPVWYDRDTSRFGHNASGSLRGMKADAWEGGHRMPFIVHWPKVVPANSQSSQLICFTDVLATLAELLETNLPADAGPDSISFLPALLGDSAHAAARNRLAMASGNGMMTMRSGAWKWVDGLGSGGFSKPGRVQPTADQPPGQLYNLDTDLGETTNLAVDHPDIVARLQRELREEMDQRFGKVERLDPALDKLIDPSLQLQVLGKGYRWAEGPAWDPRHARLIFSDVPECRMHVWAAGRKVAAFMEPSSFADPKSTDDKHVRRSGSNGLAYDAEGRLYVCDHGNRCVYRVDPDGQKTILASTYEGKRFNSPNDLVIAANGDILFTDPPYGLSSPDESEMGWCGIYRLRSDGSVLMLNNELVRPNGIGLSPDQSKLYVAQSHKPRAVYMEYTIQDDGSLDEGRVLFDATALAESAAGLPDGMAIDSLGNLWATGPGGVLIISPTGKLLGRILTDRPAANCTFGSAGHTLYVTAGDTLGCIETRVSGF